MKQQRISRRRRTTKSVLRLLDLEHAKAAVLNSLTSADAQRGYRHAIDEFVAVGRNGAAHNQGPGELLSQAMEGIQRIKN